MNKANHLVVFTLCKKRFALDISQVERIIRINKLKSQMGPSIDTVNLLRFQGRIIPLVNIRKKFNLPECSNGEHDHIIITNAFGKRRAIIVDSVRDIIESPKEDLLQAIKASRDIPGNEGLLKLSDGTLLIQNLEKLISFKDRGNNIKDLIKQAKESDFDKWFQSRKPINWEFTDQKRAMLRYYN